MYEKGLCFSFRYSFFSPHSSFLVSILILTEDFFHVSFTITNPYRRIKPNFISIHTSNTSNHFL